MTFKIINYQGLVPSIDVSVFLAPGSMVIGGVTIAKNSSVWFNTVLRGDVNPIKIGENTNIQDNSVIHTSRYDGPTIIGNNVNIGHQALVHACTVKDHAFIGMRSVIMDKAIVEEYGFVAAGSIVTNNKIVKSRELWAGVPAKFMRILGDKDLKEMHSNAEHYVKLAANYLKNL